MDGKTVSGWTRSPFTATEACERFGYSGVFLDGQQFYDFDIHWVEDLNSWVYSIDVTEVADGWHVLTLGERDDEEMPPVDHDIYVDNTTHPAVLTDLTTGRVLQDGDRIAGEAMIGVTQQLAFRGQSIDAVDFTLQGGLWHRMTDETAPFTFLVDADALPDGVFNIEVVVTLSDAREVNTIRSVSVTKGQPEFRIDHADTVIAPGQRVTVRGQLRDAVFNEALPDRTVTVHSGTGVNAPRLTTTRSGADGRFSVSFTPRTGGRAMLAPPAEPGRAAGRSQVITWSMSSTVRLRANTARPSVGQQVVFTVDTKPALAGLIVRLHQWYAGRWHEQAEFVTRRGGIVRYAGRFTRPARTYWRAN